jgi:hypothetical protein
MANLKDGRTGTRTQPPPQVDYARSLTRSGEQAEITNLFISSINALHHIFCNAKPQIKALD